jgi:predicted GIY-YIG superfamily endonuclease
MLEHLLGLLMVGIGLQPPNLEQGSVMGDETSVVETVQPTKLPLYEGTSVNTLNNNQAISTTQSQEVKKETMPVTKDKQGIVPASRVSDNKQQGEQRVSQQINNKLQVSTQEGKLVPMANVSAFNERKAAFQQEILMKREEAKERFALAREEFKQKLSAVTDQKKQTVLTTIDQRFSTINTNRTDALSKKLDRLDNIATNLSNRLTTAELEGANVTQTKTLITTAQTSIATARTAVAQQAGQEYVINITTEDALRDQAQQAKATLEADLKAVDATVKEAHDALLQAIQSLATSLKRAGVQEGGQ